MSLRFAVHNADGTFAHGGMTMCPNDAYPDVARSARAERMAAEDDLRPLPQSWPAPDCRLGRMRVLRCAAH